MAERVSDVGEFGLIRRISDLLSREGLHSDRVTLGIGDDTASFLPREGYEVLLTCDSMVEGRHYLPRYTKPFDLGARAMTLNISDIGAMGGRPLYALVSLGLKGEAAVADIEEMYRGFLAELNPLGASVIGGNLTKSRDTFIDITLIGEVEKGKGVRRSGAGAGDFIFVTGYPGQAAAGLQLLSRDPENPELLSDPLVRIYIKPTHRAPLGRAIGQAGCATAMIDTSDGFLGDLGHICEESSLGAELMMENIPLNEKLRSAAHQLNCDPRDFFLGESDDYELIVTCRPEDAERLEAVVRESGEIPLARVGTMTEKAEGIFLVLPDGSRRAAKALSWDHFRL
ncbi:MAG TPA: thiamine-phosphate kinase, partial [Thermodesulfobacteriota bacterium]|nr:thiamine-phosphate kinase [Thermodesulfobacteriota bacterium]